MFVTAVMKHLTGAVLLEDADKVAQIFLKYGVVEPVAVKNLEQADREGLNESFNTALYERVSELRRHIETLLALGNISIPLIREDVVEKMQAVNLENCQKLLATVDSEVTALRSQQQALQEKIHHKQELLRSFSKNQSESSNALLRFREDKTASEMLRVRAGRVKKIFFAALNQKLRERFNISMSTNQEEHNVLIKLVYLADREQEINQVLQQAQWTEIPLEDVIIASEEASIQDIENDIVKMQEQQLQLKKEFVRRISRYKEDLTENWTRLHVNELYSRLRGGFSNTRYMSFFSGWIPQNIIKKITADLCQATNNHIVYEIRDAEDVKDNTGKRIEPPTAMQNPKILKPFETLVKTYGVPAYNTIDSTLPVAFLFVVMFGLMFADAGHGAVIAIGGLISMMINQKNKRDLGFLMTCCGLSSIITGILFGSYFGFPLTMPIWFDFEAVANNQPSHYSLQTTITNINDVFKLSIQFGITVISLSYVFNWINRMRRHEWIELLLERNGILGGWMYGVGIYLMWNYVASNYQNFGNTSQMGWMLGMPVLLLFLAEPAKYFFYERKEGEHKFKMTMLGEWVGHWLLEIFEFVVNSLSNTMSFIRVSGLGMAHVILMSTFYGMAKNMPFASKIIVMVLANVIVITLEGLSAAINSVRLNYYEFFSRYFIGGGRMYQPVKLNE